MSRGENLYHLQQLDTERDTGRRRLVEIEAALKDDRELREARRSLETAEERARKWTIRQRDLELEIQSLADKRTRSEKRLYGGQVKNPKELTDLQAEVASLQRRRQRLDDTLLEAMIEREEAEEARDQARIALDQAESDWTTRQARLKAEQGKLEQRLEAVQQERVAVLAGIEPTVVSTYESLRKQKRGQAVALVRDEICTGCGVTISPSVEWRLRQQELCYCDTCRRILVLV
jgi:predicted  nucleic acid-binding Zn-ribbon protein